MLPRAAGINLRNYRRIKAAKHARALVVRCALVYHLSIPHAYVPGLHVVVPVGMA